MSMLDQLLGGGQRQEYDDFVNRYDQGAPWDGISDQEAVSRYQQVATQLPPDVYQQSAQDAFSRLSPDQRVQLGQYLRQQARQRNVPLQDFDQDGVDDRFQDPGQLAQMTTRLDQQQPGLLGQLLGGGGGGSMGGMLGGLGGALGGGGLGGSSGSGGILASPIAKAALAGIAAMAVKRMASGTR